MSYIKSLRGGNTVLEYRRTDDNTIRVLLNDKHSGDIVTSEGVVRFVPRGQKRGGQVFPSISAAKKFLEE